MSRTSQELNLTVLQFVANRLRDRDTSSLQDMGFGAQELEALGQLRVTELAALARRMPDNLLQIKLDKMAFRLMVDLAKNDTQQQIDFAAELLKAQAPQPMMSQLLGMSAREYAQLRKALDLPSTVGRPIAPNEEEAREIWLAWEKMHISHPGQAQPKDWLQVCQASSQPAGVVWRLVWQWYEEITDSHTDGQAEDNEDEES